MNKKIPYKVTLPIILVSFMATLAVLFWEPALIPIGVTNAIFFLQPQFAFLLYGMALLFGMPSYMFISLLAFFFPVLKNSQVLQLPVHIIFWATVGFYFGYLLDMNEKRKQN